MILELDCGNSFIKWRIIGSQDRAVVAGGIVDSDQALIGALRGLQDIWPTHCRLVSVRTEEETLGLMQALNEVFAIPIVSAKPAQEVAGVRNGYEEYERLGLDRWLAVLGAYHLAGGACLVIDFGTAVTSDFVAADGEHLGGFICPGMPLMRGQLRTHTRRIRYDDASAQKAHGSLDPGRTTVEAVERGCALMVRGFVLTQIEHARARWGEDFVLFLTGGDADLAQGIMPGVRVVPDLVFIGLAMACPLS